MSGIGKRVGLLLQPSPLPTYRVSSRGKCQWIEGEIIPGDSTDNTKCMKPTVYDQHNKLTSWCEKHYEKIWRPVVQNKRKWL